MKAKVPKCHSLSLNAFTAKISDQKLTLYGQSIHFVGNEAIKFLAVTVQIPLDSNTIEKHITWRPCLGRGDNVPITSHQKLLLYRAAICPRY